MRVVSGSSLLVQSAIQALEQWRYQPTLLNGQPVPVEMLLTLHFTLGQDSSSREESALPEFHDRGIVEVFLGGAFNSAVDLAGGSGGGQSDAQLIAKVERKSKVLVHEAQREARDVFALEQIGSFDVQHAGTGHAGLHDFDEFLAGNSGASRERQGFGEGVYLESQDEIHGQLDGLAGAILSKVKQFLAHDTENGLGFLQGFFVAANHKNKFAFFGAPIPAGDGRIEETHAARRTSGGDSASQAGGDGAGVDINAAALERAHGARVAPKHLFKGGRVAHHGEQKVRGGRHFLGRFREFGPGGNQFIGARRRAVPNGKRIAGLDEVHAHGTAHQAETDEPDLFGSGIQESPPRRRLASGREQLATRKGSL